MKQSLAPIESFCLPRPDPEIVDSARLVPCLDLWDWVQPAFIVEGEALWNPDHSDLLEAYVGFCWVGLEWEKSGVRRLGDAQLGFVTSGDKWSAALQNQIRGDWFGRVPDFLVRLDAEFFARCSNAEACAVIEHELYHCRRKLDKEGEPAEDADGNPVWTIAPHDIEEFAGVIERYGARATHSERIRRAYMNGPTISAAAIDGCCGVCGGRF